MSGNKNIQATVGVDIDISQLTRGADAAERRLKNLETQSNRVIASLSNDTAKQTAAILNYNKRIAEADKNLTQQMKESSRERQKAIGHNTEVQRGRNISARGANSAAAQESMANREELNRAGRLNLEAAKGYQRRLTLVTNDGLKQRRMLMTKEMRDTAKDASLIRRIIDKTTLAPEGTRDRVLSAIGGPVKARQRSAIGTFFGMTPQEQILGQLAAGGFNQDESQFLSGVVSKRPASLEGPQLARQRTAKEYEQTWQTLLKEREDADKARDRAEREYMQEEAAAKKQLRRDEAAFDRAEAQEKSKYTKARVAYDRQQAKITSGILRDARREEQKERREAVKLEQKAERDSASERRRAFQSMAREARREKSEIDRIINRSLSGPEDIQKQVAAALRGMGPAMQRRQALAGGATLQQAFLGNLTSAGIGSQNASFLAMGGRRPVAFGGTPPGGGGGGGRGGILGRLLGMGGGGAMGGLVSSLAGGFGIGVGGYALAGAANAIGENVERATAYDRQTIAAEQLAGSQQKLNELLREYEESSGGAVDASTALANVSRLLATGYASTVPQLEKFVRATRGASIAVGRPQDYIIQETQLAMSNTSFRRLDQIGLGIEEVQERMRELRKENVGMTREGAFQQAVLDAMTDKYGHLTDSIAGQATGIEKLRKAWEDLGLEMGQTMQRPVDAWSNYWAERFNDISEAAEKSRVAAEQQRFATNYRLAKQNFNPQSSGIAVGRYGNPLGQYANVQMPGAPPWMASIEAAQGVESGRGKLDDVAEVRESYFDRFEQLEKQHGEARLQLVEQYESQRVSLIENYNKQVAREAEDFARQSARSARDFQRSIVDMEEDAAEREAKAQEDLDENIADMREDANEKLADVEEKFQKDREKREEDHRDKLLKAAGQLDAIAILEERKRWKRENEEAKEAHEEQVDELQETLSEQIEKAREAHAEQLEEAREADAKRLEDMRESRARQLADEAEDRGIRLARQAEDHDDQLEELDRQHSLRLSQIMTQQAEERRVLNEEFQKALYDVGYFVDGMVEKMKEREQLIEDWFDAIVNRMEKELLIMNEKGRYSYDPATGPNIPLDYGSKLGYTPTPSYSASGTGVTRDGDFSRFGGGGNTITFQNGAIRVTTTEGFEERVADDVIERVIDYMEAL